MSSSIGRPDNYRLAASVAVDRARLRVALRDGWEQLRLAANVTDGNQGEITTRSGKYVW
jgi:hypothetical protein